MSIPVAIPDLQAKTAEYGWAYLLTVRDDSTPHIVAVGPRWDGGDLTMPVGRGTFKNATTRTSITVCYPPLQPDGYSLIVDGTASAAPNAEGPESEGGASIRFTPSGAVLHRSAAPDFGGSATGCSNDCAPVDRAADEVG